MQKSRITEVGDEEQEEEEEEESSSLSVSIKDNGKTAKPTVAEREASDSLTPVNGRNLPLSSPPPPPPSGVPTPTPATSAPLSVPLPKTVAPRKTLGAKSKAGEGGEVPTAKRRTSAQKRKIAKIPVINLDVDQRLQEMQEEAEKKEDQRYLRDDVFPLSLLCRGLYQHQERDQDQRISSGRPLGRFQLQYLSGI